MKRLLAVVAVGAFLVGAPLVARAQQAWATVGSPTGNPTYCYGNGCGGRHPERPNVRMPFTYQYMHSRQVLILPPRHATGFIASGGTCNRHPGDYLGADGRCHPGGARGGVLPVERPIGIGGAAHHVRRPNPIKEKYLSDCAAHGAPVRQLGGGRMNCHRDPGVVTIID